MHVQEKRAWFILGVMLATIILCVGVIAIFGFHPGALGAFGLAGVAGFAGLIGRGESRAGRIVMDERDCEITRRAGAIGFGVFWIAFIAAAYVPWAVLGSAAIINVRVAYIPFVIFPAMVVVYLAQAVTTIVLYRRGGHA